MQAETGLISGLIEGHRATIDCRNQIIKIKLRLEIFSYFVYFWIYVLMFFA